MTNFDLPLYYDEQVRGSSMEYIEDIVIRDFRDSFIAKFIDVSDNDKELIKHFIRLHNEKFNL